MHVRPCQIVLCGSVLVLLATPFGFGYQEKSPASSAPKAAPAVNASPAGTAAKATSTAKVASGEKEDPLVAQGKSRFQAYKCYDCDGKNGEGTDDAPDLTHSKLTAEQVSKFLVKPSTDAQNKGEPLVRRRQEELAAGELLSGRDAQPHALEVRLNPSPKGADGNPVDMANIFDGIDKGSLTKLQTIIDMKDSKEFAGQYKMLLEDCYSCHKTANRPYLRPQVLTTGAQPIVNLDPSATWPQ